MKKQTYKQAAQRLEEIVKEIEDDSLDIDQLFDKLKEAKELLAFCQKRIYEVDEQLKQLLPNNNENRNKSSEDHSYSF